MIHVNAETGYPYDLYTEILLNKTADIDELLHDINDNVDSWSNCESLDFLTLEIMPVVYLNEKKHYKSLNLYNFLVELQKNVNNI